MASFPAASDRTGFHALDVAAVEPLTDDAVAVTLVVPEALRERFRFRAGQHLVVRVPGLGGDERRTYSICVPAAERAPSTVRIGIKAVPQGLVSGHVTRRLAPGDVLEAMVPTGSFGPPDLDPAHARRYVAVAAGSGITPVLSVLATALAVEPRSTAALVYVNRRASSIMFLDEVEGLKNSYPDRFQVLHVLGHEAQETELLSGRLDGARLRRIIDTLLPVEDVDGWYLCGPLGLTETVREVLAERGVDPTRVHRELFHVGSAPPRPASAGVEVDAGTAAEVTVTLDGRSQTFRLARDGASVLEATLELRPDAPFACRGGVCGTCRARVVEGEVVMDTNYALEPDEVARGVILTCQSHPVSDRLVVDFDR